VVGRLLDCDVGGDVENDVEDGVVGDVVDYVGGGAAVEDTHLH